MRTILILASAAFASAAVSAGTASADDHLHVTPPILREQARTTQDVRPASELTVTPQPVPAAQAIGRVSSAGRIIVEAAVVSAR